MSRIRTCSAALLSFVTAVAGAQSAAMPSDMHHDHVMTVSSSAAPVDSMLPADAAGAAARLAASPRHREYVMISIGGTDSIGAWIFYPQRSTKAPVVVVVHEIFGMSTWVRGVGDQFAAQGFIAIAPDLLTGKKIPGGPDSVPLDSARKLIAMLRPEDVQRALIATANYAMHLPSALPRYGIVGFCWGGGVSFLSAAAQPNVLASVVYYGVSPDSTWITKVHAPVLGLYGGMDNRITSMVPATDSTLKKLSRTYQPNIFAGAGHGFLRDQTGMSGANMAAAQAAWPATIAWFRKYLELPVLK
jgi:carboxymethylenebutenolidase